MAGYWLKLFTEILGDFKYSRLSDQAKLGMYEIFLVAKETGDEDGALPELEEIAFKTRRTEDWWNGVLQELIQSEIVMVELSGRYIVRNFAKRQAPVPGIERQYQLRKKNQREEYKNQGVTETVTIRDATCNENIKGCNETSQRIEKEKEIEIEKEEDVDVSPAGDVNGGVLNPGKWVNQEMLNSFEVVSGLIAPIDQDKIMDQWVKALERMKKAGVTPDIMRQACQEMTEKKYRIVGPWSIERPCGVILGQQAREKVPRAGRKLDSQGAYADFVQH